MTYAHDMGAVSNKKRVLRSGILVLAITVGFPLLSAFMTRENLLPSPTVTAQNDEPGVVLTPAEAPSFDQPSGPSSTANQDRSFIKSSSAPANASIEGVGQNPSESNNSNVEIPVGGVGAHEEVPSEPTAPQTMRLEVNASPVSASIGIDNQGAYTSVSLNN